MDDEACYHLTLTWPHSLLTTAAMVAMPNFLLFSEHKMYFYTFESTHNPHESSFTPLGDSSLWLNYNYALTLSTDHEPLEGRA